MSNVEQFQVLSDCRLVLKLTNLYNKTGIYFVSFKIPSFLISCIILLPLVFLLLSNVWFCYDEKFNLESTSTSFAVMLGLLQTILNYVSLLMKKDLIVITVDYLQKIVATSNLFIFESNIASEYTKTSFK